jgi:hypothetical protein
MNKQMDSLQKKSGYSMTLFSQEKIDQYLSELLIRGNELKLKISENNKMIDYLSQGRMGLKDSAMYGTGGKIESLKVENSLLKSKLQQTQFSMEQMKLQTQNLPLVRKQMDDFKSKSEVELNRYKELTQTLSKIEAQKISMPMRYEVIESAQLENIKPKISLMQMLGLVLILSQSLFAFVVYTKNKALLKRGLIYTKAQNAILVAEKMKLNLQKEF